jgi:hypothetical protein
VSAPFARRWMLERLASQYPARPVDACPQADAIAVLAGTGPPRRRPLRPPESFNRMEAGLALYHAGRAPLLVQAADGVEEEGLPNLPAGSVLVVGPARNTADEARLIVAEARNRGFEASAQRVGAGNTRPARSASCSGRQRSNREPRAANRDGAVQPFGTRH